jgi:hypothetical protein
VDGLKAELLNGLGKLDPVEAAPLADAGVTSFRAVRRAAPWLAEGSRALLIGLGGVGQFALQYLRSLPEVFVGVREIDPEKVQRAAELGLPIGAEGPLFVNLERPPLLAALREGTVRDKVDALRGRGVGPAGWSAHWLRHSHATALLLAGTPDWVVSRRLGHAHVQTTLDLYGWVSEDEALRAAASWKTYTAGWRTEHDQ